MCSGAVVRSARMRQKNREEQTAVLWEESLAFWFYFLRFFPLSSFPLSLSVSIQRNNKSRCVPQYTTARKKSQRERGKETQRLFPSRALSSVAFALSLSWDSVSALNVQRTEGTLLSQQDSKGAEKRERAYRFSQAEEALLPALHDARRRRLYKPSLRHNVSRAAHPPPSRWSAHWLTDTGAARGGGW